MANPNSPYGLQWQKNQAAGAAAITKRFITGSNATLAVGDPVVLATGTTNGIKLAGVTSTGLFGVSLESVTGAAGVKKSALIIPALKDYLWCGQVKSATNITAGYIGKKFGIAGTTNGKIGLSATATTSGAQIVGLKPTSAFGTYAELLFVIAKSTWQSN
jgi:hypothetical protein